MRELAARLQGQVKALNGHFLKTPISGTPCVLYRVMAYDVLAAKCLVSKRCAFALSQGDVERTIGVDRLEVDWDQLPRLRTWTTNREFWRDGNEQYRHARTFLMHHGYRGDTWHKAGVQELIEILLPLGDSVVLQGTRATTNSSDGRTNGYRMAPQSSMLRATTLSWRGTAVSQ